jgi:hypothetical protein
LGIVAVRFGGVAVRFGLGAALCWLS